MAYTDIPAGAGQDDASAWDRVSQIICIFFLEFLHFNLEEPTVFILYKKLIAKIQGNKFKITCAATISMFSLSQPSHRNQESFSLATKKSCPYQRV
jgi:hypothetical protein